MIESKEDLQRLENKLNEIDKNLDSFALDTITNLIQGNIIQEIQRRMRQENYSEKIIDNVFLDNLKIESGVVLFQIFNEYLAPTGYDVALGLEKGIKEYTTEGKLQVFPGSQGTVFTMKTHHPERPGSNIIKDAVELKTPEIQTEYTKLEKRWLDSILNSS